ncbi:MAG: hypothetical protein AABZ60_04395 [Planctomycetota bacterium]
MPVAQIESIKESGSKHLNPGHDISIWLDSYDDIFSDFDQRPFSDRNVSDDFLYEIKKVSRESDFHINEMNLLIPEKSRHPENETVIIKRLHSYFRKNHHASIQRKRQENKKGIVFTLIGMAMMIGASYFSSIKSHGFIVHIPLVILEPAGWFLVWVGLDALFYISREQKPELDFYSKMAKSKITFKSL